MSARARAHVDEPDAYLVGLADGERHASQIALARLMEAEATIRRQADMLDQSRSFNAYLRRKLGRRSWIPAVRLAVLCSGLSFLATYNVMTNGWFS